MKMRLKIYSAKWRSFCFGISALTLTIKSSGAFSNFCRVPCVATQIAKTLKSTSIRHRSDTYASDRCLIGIDPRVFAIWELHAQYDKLPMSLGDLSLWIINSLGPSDAYMRQYFNHHCFRCWFVVCSATNHYLKQYWHIVNSNLRNKFQWNCKRNSCIFIQQNAFENVVCGMTVVLSQSQCSGNTTKSSDGSSSTWSNADNQTFRSMMTSSNGNVFRVTGHLCGEFTGFRWIPRTKASDAELWCFLWSAHERTVE